MKSAARCKLAYKDLLTVKTLQNATTPSNLFESLIVPQIANKDVEYISSEKDAQAYVWRDGPIAYITFRGTSSIQDALVDVDVKALRMNVKDGHVHVHNGFYKQFESVNKTIGDYLCAHEDITYIEFAGHSLGAGLAQIAAATYGEMFPDKTVSCHTFGCPRTGDKNFVQWFQKNVKENMRICNKNDPVTMIPQRPIWTHTYNKCIEISDNHDVHEIMQDTPWYVRWFVSMLNIDYFSPIEDHDCDVYMTFVKICNGISQVIQNVKESCIFHRRLQS